MSDSPQRMDGDSGSGVPPSSAGAKQPSVSNGVDGANVDHDSEATESEPWADFEISLDDECIERSARAMGWRCALVDRIAVSCGTLRRIPLQLAEERRCVPYAVFRERAVILVDDLVNGLAMEAHPQLLGEPYGRSIEVVLTRPSVVDRLLEKRKMAVRH